MRRMDRMSASAVLDPRGIAGILPIRGPGSRPWELYRKVPELRAGIEWMANAISRADLHVYEMTEDGRVLVEDDDINSVLRELIDTGPSASDMLKRMVFHLEAAGETYVVPYRDPRTGQLVWAVASPQELRTAAGPMELQVDNTEWVPVDGARVIRIWHPDPQFSWLAESPIIAMESILLEIISNTARTIAVNESRLQGNGLLAFPDTLNVVQPASEGHPNPIVESRDFLNAMEEAMVAPMTDRGLVSSVVPIMFTGPKDDIDAIKRIELWSKLDENAPEQMQLALRRMAISMALPPEIILGLGQTNHWNSADIIREAISTAVEPRLDVITSALTEAYLRPRLAKHGYDPDKYLVAADINDLVVPPDRSEAAAKAREEGLLTNEAWARYLGFDESDIPTGEKRKRIILERVLFAAPETAPWILPEIGITVPGFTTSNPPDRTQQEEIEDTTTPADDQELSAGEGTEDPVLGETRSDGDMSTEPREPGLAASDCASSSTAETLVSAVECAVLRVLERSNNRLLRAHGREYREKVKDVPVTELHTHLPVTQDLKAHMLKGAYTTWQSKMPRLVPIVREYVDYLYDNRVQHSTELLTETLMGMADYWPKEGEPIA